MGRKGYVIQALGYEYNDEVNHIPECGGGNPVAVYFDKELAKKKMMQLEIQSWREEIIGYYGYGIKEIAKSYSEFDNILSSMGIDEDDLYNDKLPESATDEQIIQLINASNLRFHEIVEVDTDDSYGPSDDEIGPTKEMLDLHESLYPKNKKKGIFEGIDAFAGPNVTPTPVPDNVTAQDIKKVVEETNENFLEIKEEMKRLRDEARKKVKDFFLKGMNKIFEMFPEVKTVSWRQYTPYFNDGEECVFGAHTDDFRVNDYDQYDDDSDDSSEYKNVMPYNETRGSWHTNAHTGQREWRYLNPESRAVKIKEAIQGFLSQLDNDDYKTMFGDHAKVIVMKNKVIVEEYEHD
jgi:hypothetical protein